MNASQLLETTLDPNARTLLEVEVRESDEADLIFSALMGDMTRELPAPCLYGSNRALCFNAHNCGMLRHFLD